MEKIPRRVIAAILGFTSAFSLMGASARACDGIAPEVEALLSSREFEKAELVAKARLDSSRDSPDAHADLAYVYVQWSAREETVVDTEALGFAPGETGTRQLTPDLFERAFRSEVRLDPERAGEAIGILEGAVERWPTYRRAHFCLLDIHQALDNRPALLGALTRTGRQFREEGAQTVDALLPYGSRYYERREYAGAREVMETLLKVFPDSAPVLSSLGAIKIEFEEIEEAIALFRRARRLAPADALVVRNLATAAMILGRAEEAASSLEALHKLEPDRTRVLFELAVVATARRTESVAAAWKRYLELHRRQPDSENWAAFAESSLEATKAQVSDDSVMQMARALSGAQGSLSLVLLHSLATRRPDDPSPFYFMAQAYERERLPRHALQSLQRAEKRLDYASPLMGLAPEALRFEAGRLALTVERYPDSIQYLESVEAVAPETTNLQYLLGLAHGRAGNADQAFQYFQRCLELPNNSQYANYCESNLQSGPGAPSP